MSESFSSGKLKERLEFVIGKEAPYTWATRIGLGKSTLAGILNNGACPRTSTLIKIAMNTNISINWLLTGKGSPWMEHSSTLLPEDPMTMAREPGEPYRVAPQSYVVVPRFSVTLNGQENDSFHSGQVVDHIAFKSDWILGVMGLDPNKIVLVSVIGDSMEPTLKGGDLVLLDQRDQSMRNDAIYVIRRDEDLVAKRLQRGFDGSISIKSDNAAYEDIKVPAEQVGQLSIVGRVVWSGRRI
ncbi:MAG: helix-turn-helix transcriptional regulator [Magnetococcales bacterium]|nr:helix-turn-helix transcriptional regulator [Magnetococcales bacterium]MBF0151116.1 helix-turn-helix transcriptional regulator [Magnetococcales bacterium]MBF0174034.1 helix-turn-helix transcriptional regulator [Magnetococcales bacterium]MBF0346779.1 helix-turn-helix transcriptional regulator [Magnetococcales bacterium]MBF0630974.1 helix-turn-helix transcriptional regulator [Magnetococcales bacterium]